MAGIEMRRLLSCTSVGWSVGNMVLKDGDFGVETDTRKFKIGDGRTAWRDLPYATGSISGGVTVEQVEEIIEGMHEEIKVDEVVRIWETFEND